MGMYKDTEGIKEQVAKALETYSLEDILEENDLTIEETLCLLVEHGFIVLPEAISV